MTPHAVAGSPPAPSRVATTTRFGRVRRPAWPAAPPRARLTPINPLGPALRADQRDRESELGLAADGRDPAARLHGVANRPESVAEHPGGCIEVHDREGDPPEAGGARLDVGMLDDLEDHLPETEEPLLQWPVIGLHLTHPPALDSDLIESGCRPVQLRREDDEVIDLGDAGRVASSRRRTSLRRRCLRQPVDPA